MKGIFKVMLTILVIIILLALIFFAIDYSKVNKGEKPIFCILKDEVNDGGTKIYLGLGYKVIDFHTLTGFDDIKIGNWFMNYEDFSSEIGKDETLAKENNIKHYSNTVDETFMELDIPNNWNYEEVSRNEENDFYKFALKLYKNEGSNYAMLYFYNNPVGVCGTGRTSKNIKLNNLNNATIGYYDGNKNWSDISFNETNAYIAVMNCGLTDTDAEEVIEFIKTLNIVNEQNQYSFRGTITKVEDNLFFVEPDGNEKIRKSADLIMVKKLKLDTNVKFEIGEKVKITYDGYIMETYPAQVQAIKYEAL